MNRRGHIRNPTTPLGTGKVPSQNFARRPTPKVIGWRIEERDGFVAAWVFGTRKTAQTEKKTIDEWTRKNLEPRFGPLKIALRGKTLIAIKPKTDPQKLETTKDGSPYWKSDLKQTRSSDEAETRFVTDLLTGKKARENPPSEIVITVPHAADDKIEDGHDTDWNAERAAIDLANALLNKGIDPILMIGKDNRDNYDLNREWSNMRPFHVELDKHLTNADLLIDVHSYPADYPVWGDHDVVLFAYGPLHSDEDNEQTVELAQFIQEEVPGTRVLIEQADLTRNFIQNKGLVQDLESHLIEVAEGQDPSAVMTAVANYALGAKANIPTSFPEGAVVQQFTIKFQLLRDNALTRLTMPEILEIDLEDLGFAVAKPPSYLGTSNVIERMWFKLPIGLSQIPTLMFQRNSTVAYLYKAEHLTSAEVKVVFDFVKEAIAEQPLSNPTAKDKRKTKLTELGVPEEMANEIVELINDGSNKTKIFAMASGEGADLRGETWKELTAMKDDPKTKLTKDSTEEEIRAVLKEKKIEAPMSNSGNFKKAEALFLADGIVTNQLTNKTLEEALKEKKIEKPMKDGKLDRDKAMKLLGGEGDKTAVAVTEFSKKTNEKVKLSTPITKMVISDLFPGAHKIPQEQKSQGKGGQGKGQFRKLDLRKVRNLNEFKSLSQAEKSRLLPKFGEGTPLYKEIQNKFGGKDIFENPPVKAIPSSGQFTMNVTGEFVKDSSVAVTANGAAAQLNVGTLEVPPSGELGRGMGKLVRINMFRRKAGFKILDQSRQPDYIVSVETGSSHYYAKSKVKVDGYARLRHFPEKKSEPRLRVETRGTLEFGNQVGTLSVRGREHPLYDVIVVKQRLENPPAIGYDRVMDMTRTIPKGTAIMHKPTRHKMFFESIETDEDGDTWYILKDEDGTITRIFADEIDNYSLYPTSSVWKMNPPGEYKMNPSAYAEQYVKDHTLMSSKEEKKFSRFKLKGKLGTAEFFEQIGNKMQVFGEGQGWVRDGYLYWKKGPGHLNYVEVDGHMLKGGTAWMHTHPAAWEPSQTSPDDYKVMHGLFINHGVRDFFTIIADRIDWFRTKKKDKIPIEEMIEVVQEFEEDIEREFHIAEEKFQEKMGEEPYLTSAQTRYITEHLNKVIPEFEMSYRAYSLSPQQMNGRSIPNPPPRVPVQGFFRS